MDYFQGVVTEYLRADRATFVNTECLIQLEPGKAPPKEKHWYCDAVAVDFRELAVFLCEVTYSSTLQSLTGRLELWERNWSGIRRAIQDDCCIPIKDEMRPWKVQPWLFVPKRSCARLRKKLSAFSWIEAEEHMPFPLITHFEDVTPWEYCTYDRKQKHLCKCTSESASNCPP